MSTTSQQISIYSRNVPKVHRPALAALLRCMENLSGRQRREIATKGRKARAAKDRRIRRLTREVTAEMRRMAAHHG
jgi:hypothetical protein